MRLVDFAVRSEQQELMDQPSIRLNDMRRCLRDLERINMATLAYRPILAWLDEMTAGMSRQTRQEIRILDIGSGGGDTLRRIWRWAKRRGINVALTGLDLSPHAQTVARERTPDEAPIGYVTADIFRYQPCAPYSFVINSLMTHHLRDAEIIRLLTWMEHNAAYGWFINDLHRHWLPYHFIKRAGPLLRLDPIVCHDAPVSVARSFTGRDWQELLAQAEIPAARIRWHFPFRYGVSCGKV